VRVRRRNEIDLGPRLPSPIHATTSAWSSTSAWGLPSRQQGLSHCTPAGRDATPSPSTRGNHSTTAQPPSDQAGAPPGHRNPLGAPPTVGRPSALARERSSAGGSSPSARRGQGARNRLTTPAVARRCSRSSDRGQHLPRQRHRGATVNAVQPCAFIELRATPQALVVHNRCPAYWAHAPISLAYHRSSSLCQHRQQRSHT
jgi:hypothetical protein